MKLFEFRDKMTADAEIRTTVVTDGIGQQKEFFITETPRLLNEELEKLGWSFVAGHQTSIKELVDFAATANVFLVETEEGGKGETTVLYTPVETVYVFTVDKNEVTLLATASTDVVVVTSTRKVGEGDAEEEDYSATSSGEWLTFDKETGTISATANTGGQREGILILKQDRSGNELPIAVSQAATE